MDAFVDLSWRAYPGGVLLATGAGLLIFGLHRLATTFRPSVNDRDRPIVLVSAFRISIIGIALSGLAGAWIWQQVWLLALALAFGAEELLETSFALYVLRRGQRVEGLAAR